MRVVNFADGFVLEEPPMTSGSVQEDFDFLNNRSVWTKITGYSFDSSKISSASIVLEVERKYDSSVLRQVINLDLFHNGTSWTLNFGAFSGNDFLTNDNLIDEFSVALRVDPVTGDLEYKSGYIVATTHSGKFKFSTIRRKA